MPQLTIPHGPQDLTPNWLTEALRSTGAIRDVAISNIELERVGAGSGFLGVCVRITPTYTSPAALSPTSMIAKFPLSDSGAKAAANSTGLHGREIRFYAELAGKVCIATPQVY
ncbi:MAG: hypothetical protein IIC24_04560, partial [Chloroflexi bacterium]|nr:hypothetical protein [Chloroflexota bacterium]